MRRYDDPVDVRRGEDCGPEPGGSAGVLASALDEGAPRQFRWRGRVWLVRSVVAHWLETGAWWLPAPQRGAQGQGRHEATGLLGADPLGEREFWRVEAVHGAVHGQRVVGNTGSPGCPDGPVSGVFDLVFDWTSGDWQLAGCVD